MIVILWKMVILLLKVAQIFQTVVDIVDPKFIEKWQLYILKTGRKYWLSLFVNPAGETIASDFSDSLHAVLVTALENEYPSCNLDILITRQEDYQR